MNAASAGLQLGPYQLVSPLGVGGMGEVWKARDTRLNRTVAIKISQQQFSERFEREARSIAALNHPNICALYDVGPDYLVMEYVDGSPLSHVRGIRTILDVAVQIADGLAAAHAAGIVHRDLKPDNVLLTREGRVKILDFGLAKYEAASKTDADLTRTASATQPGVVMGTVSYMSPEQARGLPLDARSDQFSFGLMLYELASGKRPFQRESSVQTMNAIIEADPEPLPASVPAPLRWIIERCLSKEVSGRYESTRDLYQDLRLVRDHLSESLQVRPAITWNRRRLYRFSGFLAASFLTGAVLVYWLKPGFVEPPTIETLTYSGSDASPAASPDGQTVAFSSARDGTPRIWLKRLKGGAEVALTLGPDSSPRFSPDGTTILFSRSEGTHRSLYKVASVGGEPRKVIDDALDGDFSPDGRRIVFIRWNRDDRRQTTLVGLSAADGSAVIQIAKIPDVRLNSPRWSPDGSVIAAVGGTTTVSLGVFGIEVWASLH